MHLDKPENLEHDLDIMLMLQLISGKGFTTPGGTMILGYDWFKGPDALNDNMRQWRTVAGGYVTPGRYDL